MPPDADSPPLVVEGPSRRCDTTRGRVRTSSPELFGTLPAPLFAFFAAFFEPPALFFFAEDFFAVAFLREVFFAAAFFFCAAFLGVVFRALFFALFLPAFLRAAFFPAGFFRDFAAAFFRAFRAAFFFVVFLRAAISMDLRWIEAESGARA